MVRMLWMDTMVWVETGLAVMLCHDSGLGEKE
jgi:hypothetical protein